MEKLGGFLPAIGAKRVRVCVCAHVKGKVRERYVRDDDSQNEI